MEKKKISAQSKSFIILFSIAAIGTYGTILASKLTAKTLPQPVVPTVMQNAPANQTAPSNTQTALPTPAASSTIDTTLWKKYTDTRYHFSLLYPPAWKVSAGGINKDGYYIVNIHTAVPATKGESMIISLSRAGFLGIDGLSATHEQLAGQDALNLNDQLYGIQYKNYYYTFDLNSALDFKPQFKKLVDSVIFPQ